MINPTSMSNVQSVLTQIRQYQADIADGVDITSQPLNISAGTGSTGFAESIKTALQEVNMTQQTAAAMKSGYEQGSDIPLTDVVMSIQKSSLAFEATLQIRNKVLKAYEEIINMPV